VVVDGQSGGGCVRAELAAAAAVAMHVNQSGQEGPLPDPTSRGLHISPPRRKVRSLASKRDPVTVDHHCTVTDNGGRRDKSTCQQDACVSPQARMMDFVAVLGAVGVDIGRPEVTTVSQ
jgi:hypothetical protein